MNHAILNQPRPCALGLFLLLLILLPCRDLFASIVREETVSKGDIASSLTLPSIQGGTDQTYVLYIATRHNRDVISVTGGGLTWNEWKEQCAGRAQTGIRVWTAQGSPGSFQAEITITEVKPVTAILTRYSGVDSFEDATGENTNGENGGCSGGVDDTASQLTLTSSTAGSVHSIGLAPRNRNIVTFTSGYTEVANDVSGSGGEMTKLIVYEKEFGAPTTDTFAATLSSDQDWATAGLVLVPGALTVELTTFEALTDGRTVRLRWETASETNNAGFEVQRRRAKGPATQAGQEPWDVLAFVEGQGTSLEAQTYHYRVEDLDPGPHVFRLKQIDYDGTFEYHLEVEVIVEMVERFVLEPAYPNPFNPQTQFRFAVRRSQPVQIGLFDVLGRHLKQLYTGAPAAGQMYTVWIDGSDLPSGLYIVRVAGETILETQTVLLAK